MFDRPIEEQPEIISPSSSKNTASSSPQKKMSPEPIITPSHNKFSEMFAEPVQSKLGLIVPASLPQVKMSESAEVPIPKVEDQLVRSYIRTYIAVN